MMEVYHGSFTPFRFTTGGGERELNIKGFVPVSTTDINKTWDR